MPPSSDRVLGDFQVGQRVRFRRRFSRKDYEAFAELSGDRSPLHHDRRYAAASRFGETILPLHLTAAPLSAIAGMLLPGHRSLYLQSRQRALAPARYDRDIVYSARITAINAARETLTLRVLALDGAEVLLDAELMVQVRDDVPADLAPPRDQAIAVETPGKPLAAITGATGAIGRAVALSLARSGRDMILVHHGRGDAAKALAQACRAEGAEVALASAALETAAGRKRLCRRLAENDRLTELIHCASPPLNAGSDVLMAVNHQALAEIAEALLPGWLRRQEGRLVFLGSSAVQHNPAGWGAYIAAKSAASQWVSAFQDRYGSYGLAAWTLAPGYVRTPFSAKVRPKDAPALLPEQIAEAVADCLDRPAPASGTYLWLEPGAERLGRFGFHQADNPTSPAVVPQVEPAASASPLANGEGRAADAIRRFFGAAPSLDMSQAGVDQFPGWDSLKHIELILSLERDLGIAFSGAEIERTARYAELCALVERKLGTASPS